jgi:hypothetical protein
VQLSLASEETEAKPASYRVSIPDRYSLLIQDYERLTCSRLSQDFIQDFIDHAAAGRLSVIDRERRLKSGRQARRSLQNGLFSLDLQIWLDHIYDNPQLATATRVWITTKGEKYHLERDCRGILEGQSYARAFGKDTYNPQFVEIHEASFVLGKTPCRICNPPTYQKR